MRISLSFLPLALCASAASLAADDVAVAGAPSASNHTEAIPADAPAGPSTGTPTEPTSKAGVRVYVDPATGRRINQPTAQQRAAAAASDRENPAFSTSSEGLREERLPGGGVLVHLDGRFQSAVTVHRNADGSLVQTCNNPIHESLGEGHTHAAPVVVPREER